jgi:hypothetical protein
LKGEIKALFTTVYIFEKFSSKYCKSLKNPRGQLRIEEDKKV